MTGLTAQAHGSDDSDEINAMLLRGLAPGLRWASCCLSS